VNAVGRATDATCAVFRTKEGNLLPQYGYYATIALLLLAAALAVARAPRSVGGWVKLIAIVVVAGSPFAGYAFSSLGATPQANGTVLLGRYWRLSQYGAAIGLLTYAAGALVDEILERSKSRHI